MSTLKNIPVKTITGEETTLGAIDAEVLLVVNVASKCGQTYQYESLEALQQSHGDRGLSVCGFPANDFGGQEPGSEDEIVEFCQTSYGVSFPMFSKIVATGDDRHPLYTELIAQQAVPDGDHQKYRDRLTGLGIETTELPEVLWNFEKFLIGKDGTVVNRFPPNVTVEDPMVVEAIEAALNA